MESKGRWTKQEHMLFLIALSYYGKDWKNIREMIPSRSVAQIRSHAQKYFKKRLEASEQTPPTPKLFRLEGTDKMFTDYFYFLSTLQDYNNSFYYWATQSNHFMKKHAQEHTEEVPPSKIRIE